MHNSKGGAQRNHAKYRARQRLGINLNKYARRELIWNIQNGKCRFVCHQTNRVSVFNYIINGVDTDIYYDKIRKNIITFIPRKEKVTGLDYTAIGKGYVPEDNHDIKRKLDMLNNAGRPARSGPQKY